jgi:hypothetical protein
LTPELRATPTEWRTAMVLLASTFDQSKYLNAGDLTEEKKLRIKSVTVEMVRQDSGQKQRPVLWFTNHKKGLVLNTTNNRTPRAALGDDMEKWVEKIIVVYPTHTDFAGKTVSALRVRIPPPKEAATGNGSKPKGSVQEVLPPEPKPPLADDLDDEIPF